MGTKFEVNRNRLEVSKTFTLYDSSSSLEYVTLNLKELAERYSTHSDAELAINYECYYDECNFNLEIRYKELESDEEMATRIAIEEKKLEKYKKIAEAKAQKKAKELEKEYKLYETLKRKFEKE